MARVIKLCNKDEVDSNLNIRVIIKNEPRKYMGPKWARVPRGAIVRLIAVINGKMAIFEWNGERFNCPIRLLHRIKTENLSKPEEG